jgi:protein-S-isoprenylcysteine O-methyltransferase Ste14
VIALSYFALFTLNLTESEVWPNVLREEVFKYSLDRDHWLQRRDNAAILGCDKPSMFESVLRELHENERETQSYDAGIGGDSSRTGGVGRLRADGTIRGDGQTGGLPGAKVQTASDDGADTDSGVSLIFKSIVDSLNSVKSVNVLLSKNGWENLPLDTFHEIINAINLSHLFKNAAHVVIFGVTHSIFSRTSVKKMLDLGVIYERSVYLILSSGLLIHVLTFWGAHPIIAVPYTITNTAKSGGGALDENHANLRDSSAVRNCAVSGVIYEWGKPTIFATWLPCVLGTLLLTYSLLSVDIFDFIGVKQSWGLGKYAPKTSTKSEITSDDDAVAAEHQREGEVYTSACPLSTAGLYGMVRHPMMMGMMILLWCAPFMTVDRLFFASFWTAYIFIGTVFEERQLKEELVGYVEYCKQVSDAFLPMRYLLTCRCCRKVEMSKKSGPPVGKM